MQHADFPTATPGVDHLTRAVTTVVPVQQSVGLRVDSTESCDGQDNDCDVSCAEFPCDIDTDTWFVGCDAYVTINLARTALTTTRRTSRGTPRSATVRTTTATWPSMTRTPMSPACDNVVRGQRPGDHLSATATTTMSANFGLCATRRDLRWSGQHRLRRRGREQLDIVRDLRETSIPTRGSRTATRTSRSTGPDCFDDDAANFPGNTRRSATVRTTTATWPSMTRTPMSPVG